MSPQNDYPTAEELQRIREWPLDDPKGFLEFARSCWWAADWGWPDLEGTVSTGGWSGNEEIIDAMQEAQMGLLWFQVWWSTHKGGHYELRLPGSLVRQLPVGGGGDAVPAWVNKTTGTH